MIRDRIGVFGLGKMGRALAARMASAGHEVAGGTRSGITAGEAGALGIIACDTLHELADEAGMLLISVQGEAAVAQILTALSALDMTGRLVVETSTVGPDVIRAHAADLVEKGARLIDAPISGGPEMLEAGTAGFLIGGDPGDADRFRPIAGCLGNRIHHIGGLGDGYAGKMVNNMLLAGYLQTLKETVQAGKRMGLDLPTMLGLLSNSPAASGFFVARLPRLAGEDDSVVFSVDQAVMGLTLFTATAHASGTEVPSLAAALESFQSASLAGYGDKDVAVAIRAAYAAA